jgi:drug/metabolite transporter (DMT)-like permease
MLTSYRDRVLSLALKDMTNDGTTRAGLLFALVAAASFGLSGSLARGLIDAGWSPGGVVLARVGIAALVVAPLAARALRGRWGLLRRNARIVLLYGAVAVAGTQFAYFSAVAAMDVGPALLIEFTAPAAIVVWLWLRHGERPRAITLAGAAVAAAGLVLVLDLLSGADLALDGVLWALVAMLGAAMYFVMSADTRGGVPPVVLAGGGLAVGAIGLAVLGVAGILPMRATTTAPTYGGHAVAWWLPFVGLGVITAAIAYTSGIAASRRLGSRLASFVALLEVVAGVLFAWLLLDQVPGTLQVLGGALILAGVVVVKLGEQPQPAAVARAASATGPAVAAGVAD